VVAGFHVNSLGGCAAAVPWSCGICPENFPYRHPSNRIYISKGEIVKVFTLAERQCAPTKLKIGSYRSASKWASETSRIGSRFGEPLAHHPLYVPSMYVVF
jgi:hypothetical protein